MRAAFALATVAICIATVDVAAQRQFDLLVTVADTSGEEVTTLAPGDLRVLEDGVEAQVLKVEPFSRPLKVQILIDNGIGMGGENVQDLRNGVRGLLEALPEGIEVSMYTTSPQPRPLVRATTSREDQLKAVGLLAPDSSAGRFVESMAEATQRIERDRTEHTPVIVSVGTTSGDVNVRDRDLEQIMERVQKTRTTVHVVIVTARPRGAAGGYIQGELGQAVAQATGGRFENIAIAGRLATLLPEIGQQVNASYGGGGARQFRVTAERPSGQSGDLGRISMQGVGTIAIVSVTMD